MYKGSVNPPLFMFFFFIYYNHSLILKLSLLYFNSSSILVIYAYLLYLCFISHFFYNRLYHFYIYSNNKKSQITILRYTLLIMEILISSSQNTQHLIPLTGLRRELQSKGALRIHRYLIDVHTALARSPRAEAIRADSTPDTGVLGRYGNT